jgi:hypothetical protein
LRYEKSEDEDQSIEVMFWEGGREDKNIDDASSGPEGRGPRSEPHVDNKKAQATVALSVRPVRLAPRSGVHTVRVGGARFGKSDP